MVRSWQMIESYQRRQEAFQKQARTMRIAMPNEIATPSSVLKTKELSFDEYVLLREEIRHQDNLINARLSWLVSSQAFLLSGFAITLNGTAQPLLAVFAKVNVVLFAALPVAGLVTDMVSYLTIWAAIRRMTTIRNLAHGYHPTQLPTVQADAFDRRLGLSGAVLIPLNFFSVWLAIIIQRWAL